MLFIINVRPEIVNIERRNTIQGNASLARVMVRVAQPATSQNPRNTCATLAPISSTAYPPSITKSVGNPRPAWWPGGRDNANVARALRNASLRSQRDIRAQLRGEIVRLDVMPEAADRPHGGIASRVLPRVV